MTHDDFRRVEAWLYSIPRLEVAIETLQLELEKLDTKAASPPRWLSNPAGTFSSGGNLDSRQVKWVEFMDEYPVRRNEVLEAIRERRQQVACFNKVMDMLRAENGQLAQLVRKKYLEKVQPDRVIWDHIVVSERTFYRMRRYVVESFYECIPGEFGSGNNGRMLAGKSA